MLLLQVDDVLNILKLQRAADTVVGNEFIRGVSGGEKRRLTIGEMLVRQLNLLLSFKTSFQYTTNDAVSVEYCADGQPACAVPG